MPSDTSKGLIQTSRGASPFAGAFYSTTYSTQYTPKEALNKNEIQAIASNTDKHFHNSPSSSPHSQYFDWKDKRGINRFISETKSNHHPSKLERANDTTNWMPQTKLNDETAYVISHMPNIALGSNKQSDYQTTTRKDYPIPAQINQMDSPIARTMREQRTSYTINNICTAGLENHDLHLYDGSIDEHATKQLQKYESARTGRPGAIGDNAYTRDAHLNDSRDHTTRNAKDTEYGQRYRADAPDSTGAYASAVGAGYAALSQTSPHPNGTSMTPSVGKNYLATARTSAFTKNDDSMPLGGTRSYITETGEKFQKVKSPEYGLALSGSNSGFVNGHPMAQILSMNTFDEPSSNGADASHLERLKLWRQAHLSN